MNIKTCTTYWRIPRALTAAAFTLTAFCLPTVTRAQTVAPPPPNDEIVELSPFVVNTTKDVGYMANSTLGGTRTNTELKDLANPLDVFTPTLMQDLGIQDIQDLTNFASGVEPNAAGSMNADGQEREVWNYNYMQIRGFKIGTLTRNFMQLNAQFEAYNSDRVEFSKGPNAILSGIGDPGGSVNYTTKVPLLHKSKYTIGYRTDDLGSQRATVDINQVLLKNKLGLRFNALWEDEEYYRRPSYERQKAWHLTGQWRPTRTTTINVGYEFRDSERATPRGIYPNDRVTLWLDAGSKLATSVSGANVVVSGSTVVATSQGMATITGDTWVLDSDGKIRTTKNTARGNVLQYNGTTLDTVAAGLDYPTDVWIGGPNGINDSKWNIAEISVTQTVGKDLSFEVSYGNSSNRVRQGNSVSRELYVDTNAYNEAAGNLHPGELYAETRPFWIDRKFDISHYRGSVSYRLDLTKVNKWLGDHQLAGAIEYNERDEWQNNGRLSLIKRPGATPAAKNTAFWIRDYLNPAKGKYAMRDLRDLYYSDGFEQDGYEVRYTPTEGYAFYNWQVRQNTMLGVLQSRWLQNRLITTIGLRKDKVAKYVASTYQDPTTKTWLPGTAGNITGIHPKDAPFLAAPQVDRGTSRNYGAVLHITKWLSLTGNYATNVNAATESRGFSGDYLPQSEGESKDYGVRFNLFDDRLHISLVHFETSQKKAAAQASEINSPIDELQAMETILYDNHVTQTDRLGRSGDYGISDRDAEGEELTIIGNLTRQWTFRIAASRMVNRKNNIAPDLRAWYMANIAFYEQQDRTLKSSNVSSANDYGYYLDKGKNKYALMDTLEKTESFPASEYNVRATTKYEFAKPTFLKGFAAGGSIRWSSAPIIGYYKTRSAAGDTYYDTSIKYKGDALTYVDLFFTYERVIWRNVLWKVQLNITNVFDKDDPVPNRAVNDIDGPGYKWISWSSRPVDGRMFVLSSSLSF